MADNLPFVQRIEGLSQDSHAYLAATKSGTKSVAEYLEHVSKEMRAAVEHLDME